MDNKKLEYRMYGLVPYNISDIQKAIQYGHAVQEYNNSMFAFVHSGEDFNPKEHEDFLAFEKWRVEDKTFIILNGGTTNKSIREGNNDLDKQYLGTLNNHDVSLRRNGVHTAKFYEPDLGDQLTAVVFLVDERVFNKDKYPDFELTVLGLDPTQFGVKHLGNPYYKRWVESVGGMQNVWLRDFLKQFRLA